MFNSLEAFCGLSLNDTMLSFQNPQLNFSGIIMEARYISQQKPVSWKSAYRYISQQKLLNVTSARSLQQ